MLLYIHVPFCVAKCRYCAFCSHTPAEGDMQTYVDALCMEMAHWSDALGRPRAQSVYFGGGTPSMLPEKALGILFTKLHSAFRIEKHAEITFEANPDTVAAHAGAYLKTLKDLGVSRLSLGVQSLNDDFLRLLGRPHTARHATNAYKLARSIGFANINLDFMWGLPGQRIKLWLDELKRIAELSPDHVSSYGLTLEEGTPLEKAWREGLLELPGEDDQAKMFLYGAEFLEGRGLLQYEVSNFARMGFTSRHNLGYWEGRDYLGLGPSAVSTIKRRRWANPDTLSYYALTAKRRRFGQDAEELSPSDRVKELVMLRLRTTRGLRLRAYRELTGQPFTAKHQASIQALRAHNLIRIQDGYLRLTREGMLVSNAILSNLLALE